MQPIHSNIATIATIACLSIASVLPAQAAQSDPEIIIYRFAGVFDNGGIDNTGVATSFHCTNFSGAIENIRFVVRDFDTAIRANVVNPIAHLATITASTHSTLLYSDNIALGTTAVAQGTAAIAATSTNVICTAVTLDATLTTPTGFALRGVRFNPAPGSQE